MKLRNLLIAGTCFVAAFIVMRPLGKELRTWLNQPDWNAESLKLKKSLGLPKRLDALTTIVDATLEPKQTTYWHRLDTSDGLDFQAIEQNIRKGVCGNPTLAEDVRKGITMSYRYADAANKPVATINISSCP
jgi:hypothetical protein